MSRLCQHRITKIYTIFVAVVTFMIVLDLVEFSARPFTITVGKKSNVFGQLQINVNHMRTLDAVEKKVPPFIKVKNARTYLFSAIISRVETNHNKQNQTKTITKVTSTAIVTGWELGKYSSVDFKCCFRLKNDKYVSIISSHKSHWLYVGKAKLQAKQFKCLINFNVEDINSITILSDINAACPKEKQFYLVPTIVKRKINPANVRERKIGVCVKLTYGSLDAQRLIEWFEIHKLFGVDKVIAYTYNLNQNASKVLKFYERSGMAEVYGFDLPEKGVISRDVGVKNMQSWNDEQITLFDCQERLSNYDYVAVVDTDEFIVPNTKRFQDAWKVFLDKKFRKVTLAGLLFSVRIHADTWGQTNKSHPLYIGQYSNCTLPMLDRVKGIYMPSRTQPGSVSTHAFRPLKGFNRAYVKAQEASMHHYRSCRKEWLKPCSVEVSKEKRYLYNMKNTTKCFDLRRSHSQITEELANVVRDEVLLQVQEIGV